TLTFRSGQTYNIGDGVDDRMEIQSGNVTFSTGSNVLVDGDFLVSGGALTGSSGSNLQVSDYVNFSAGTVNWNGTSILLNGATEQLIDGDFTGTATMDDVTINNSSVTGVTVNSGTVEIDGTLTLTDGIVNTTSTETITLTSSGDWTDASIASYISGPIGKENIAASSTYEFPVGKGGRYAPGYVVDVVNGGQDWSVEYFTSTGSFNSNSFDSSDPGSGFNSVTEVFSSDRWEIISSGSNSAQIRLTYGSHLSLSDEADLRVVWWDTGDSRWENQGGSIDGDATSGLATSENFIGFTTQQFALALAPNVPLPVELLYFEGELTNDGALLKWATASEIDNDRFEIERSVDGENFEVIGEVAGNGTTNELITYQFVDDLPVRGLNYYRMRQVDFDGDFEYSPTVLVDNRDGTVSFDARVFPNPTQQGNINLRLSTGDENSDVSLVIYNMEGKVFHSEVFTAQEVRSGVKLVQSQTMEAGIYLLQIRQAGQQKQVRLMIR
ncbi:MAG: T9SS type A sorting domain-containing protein, partial [Bacteroidota bacterium]